MSSTARLAHQHLLEAALQGGVLLDPLPVLVQRGRADHAQLAAGQHRLEHVARVHRALGRARADHRVQLVDERDDLAVALPDLVQHGLEPLLELAAVLGPGHHRAEVQRDQPLVPQGFGHVAGHDPLGQPLDDRGLAHAGLADQHRVVLGPPGQHLDDPPDLGVPADDRVQLAVPGRLGQVDAELLQRLVRVLGVLAGDPGAAADLAERLEQRVGRGTRRGQHGLGLAAVGGQADQQVLGRDVLVVQLPRPAGRGGDRGQQRAGHLRRAQRGAAGAGEAGQPLLGLLGDQRRVGADGAEQRGGGPVRLLQQRQEQVQRVNLWAAVRRRAPYCDRQRVLALVSELVVHLFISSGRPGSGRPSHRFPDRDPGAAHRHEAFAPGSGVTATTAQLGQPGRHSAGGFELHPQLGDLGVQLGDEPPSLLEFPVLVQDQLDAGEVDALFLRQPLDLTQRQDVPHRVAPAPALAAAR